MGIKSECLRLGEGRRGMRIIGSPAYLFAEHKFLEQTNLRLKILGKFVRLQVRMTPSQDATPTQASSLRGTPVQDRWAAVAGCGKHRGEKQAENVCDHPETLQGVHRSLIRGNMFISWRWSLVSSELDRARYLKRAIESWGAVPS